MFAELADPWEAARQSTLREARGGERKRAAGAGRKPKLVLHDRLLLTLLGIRLRTLADVFAYAEAEAVELRLDGAETQVRRPQTGRPGRRAFVAGKRKQHTIKTTTFSDGQGRMPLSGVVRPGRTHDQTAVRTEGIAEQFRLHPSVKSQADAGYAGPAKEFPGIQEVSDAVITPATPRSSHLRPAASGQPVCRP
ncbi:DDE superfamily endonuclease [Streptomyces sp. BK022]|uniref:transposase family protein n=1 Tax=Streptomyces sp. BK022 TaxID=2512123 RepID=UPI0010EEA31A|nr:transposase family protein [Streptomyces sp. BK022]RZU46383.1 DDE superfamily endonuclease [Streptomyces sp. BK022]